MSLLEQASLVITPNAYKENILYSVIPNTTLGDMDVVRATTATRVNSAGLIESVAVNVPRIDYTNGSCPSLLVEPQRTNLLTYSEEFDNAAWNPNEITITANNTISPNGTQNADRALETAANAYHDILNLNAILSAGSTYTFSCFVKFAGREFIYLFISNGIAAAAVKFNIQTGVALGTALGTVVSSKIENYGNGWYRCSVVYTSAILSGATLAVSTTNTGALSLAPYTGDITKGIYIWGAQLEVGSYATSYIPTVASTVTRNADVISKTGISSLIGQTEGTLYAEISAQASSTNNWFQILDGTANNWIFIGLDVNTFRGFVRLGSSTVFSDTSFVLTNGVPAKIALAYKSGDIALYINGIQRAVSSATFTPSASIDRVIFGDLNNAPNEASKYKSAILFKTRLTNTELAQLTTL